MGGGRRTTGRGRGGTSGRVGLAAVALTSLGALGALSTATAPSAGAAPTASANGAYPVGTDLTGFGTELTDPTGMPPGVSNAPCTASAAHPYPVVLVHGTFANENFSWQALAPMLANAGYCVFGLDYGATSWTAASGNRMYGEDFVESSAAQLGDFVKQVLAWTTEPDGANATQVDIVGHSQGGMMPRYYIGFLGGASYVHTLVGLAPSNHGTTAGGLVTLAGLFGPGQYSSASAYGCGACGE
ncbi:MAG: esterase/lipase family protein, partial [Acidimicrobiales bacterium]